MNLSSSSADKYYLLQMTWGKAFLGWSATPADALSLALDLNDRFALDGCDPASYAGVAWCFGWADGPRAAQGTLVSGALRTRGTAKHTNVATRFAAWVDSAAEIV